MQHGHIGTEHILLGLLRENEGVAGRVLTGLGVTADGVREQVVQIVGYGEEPTAGQIPFTPRAKKVLELSLREAQNLGHFNIDTEHILLGLIREHEGVAARILGHLDADADTVRAETLEVLLSSPQRRSGRTPQYKIDQAWLTGLGGALNTLAGEIRRQLKREPDIGDLLIALACAPGTLASEALHRIGIDPEQLRGEINNLRAEALPSEQARALRIEKVRQAKELAIEAQYFETAARMRDTERQLSQGKEVMDPEAFQQIRQNLGLRTRTDNPPPVR